jgi:hypothetical protein
MEDMQLVKKKTTIDGNYSEDDEVTATFCGRLSNSLRYMHKEEMKENKTKESVKHEDCRRMRNCSCVLFSGRKQMGGRNCVREEHLTNGRGFTIVCLKKNVGERRKKMAVGAW